MRPFLLIINDDGVYAPGIKHLWQSVEEYADTAIVAPLTEKSGCGTAITLNEPLKVQAISWERDVMAWGISGTPVDCVKMALNVLLDRRPDMIISGINRGANSGRTVSCSGTVSSVMEGAFQGIPGIAFSFSDKDSLPSLSVTEKYIYPLIQYFINHPPPPETILNVNFPYNCAFNIKGLRFAKQGRGHSIEKPEMRIHPEGASYYWLGNKWSAFEEEADSDVALLADGYVTVVPLKVGSMTHFELFAEHKNFVLEKNYVLPTITESLALDKETL